MFEAVSCSSSHRTPGTTHGSSRTGPALPRPGGIPRRRQAHERNPAARLGMRRTYQHARFIGQCLESTLAQRTSFPFEIIIGEDESTDGTREICVEYARRHPDRIRLFPRSRALSAFIMAGSTKRLNGTWTRVPPAALTSRSAKAMITGLRRTSCRNRPSSWSVIRNARCAFTMRSSCTKADEPPPRSWYGDDQMRPFYDMNDSCVRTSSRQHRSSTGAARSSNRRRRGGTACPWATGRFSCSSRRTASSAICPTRCGLSPARRRRLGLEGSPPATGANGGRTGSIPDGIRLEAA